MCCQSTPRNLLDGDSGPLALLLVDCGLFSTRGAPVDADVGGDHILLGVFANALIRRNEAARSVSAGELIGCVVPFVIVRWWLKVDVGFFLCEPLVQRFALSRLLRRVSLCPGTSQFLRWRDAFVKHVIDPPVDQAFVRLQLP